MKVFVDSSAVKNNIIEITNPVDVKHLVRVLRVKPGEKLQISDGLRWEYETEICEITEEAVITKIIDKQGLARLSNTKISLFQGVPKAGKMELIVQKAVELGVSNVIPVFMDRCVVVDKGNYAKKVQRYQKIADEAAKQCRRSDLPLVSDSIKLKELPSLLKQYDLVLIPYENETGRTIKDALREFCDTYTGESKADEICREAESKADEICREAESKVDETCPEVKNKSADAAEAAKFSKEKSVAIIIGPEGGFAEEEVKMIKEAGADCVSLGKTILRTETAGITAIAMVNYELEL